MATTDFGAASALRVKEWSLTVTMQGRDDSFWFSNGFVSASTADQNKPIQRVTELSKTKRGLECVMPMAMDISADAAVVEHQGPAGAHDRDLHRAGAARARLGRPAAVSRRWARVAAR